MERARQVRAEEEKKVRLDDEEAEIRHRSRVSSLGIVIPLQKAQTLLQMMMNQKIMKSLRAKMMSTILKQGRQQTHKWNNPH